jgi:hypothetical protein
MYTANLRMEKIYRELSQKCVERWISLQSADDTHLGENGGLATPVSIEDAEEGVLEVLLV